MADRALTSRLRESAKALRGLSPCSEHSYELLDVVAWNIAAELTEAADALEAQPLTLDQRYWLDRRVEIIAALAADGLQICSDKDKVWLRRSAPPSAQVAQEGAAGVATGGGNSNG